jgi:hypothetical protein
MKAPVTTANAATAENQDPHQVSSTDPCEPKKEREAS